MPRIATRHAHKLAYRRRLCLGVRMLGCLVMLAGAIVLAAALAELAKGPLSREAWLMVGWGGVLFLCGATLFCGERGLLIDREARTLKRWWGVVVPLRRSCDDISHYQAVRFYPCADAALPRWRACLCDQQGEQLELFEVAGEDVAEFAARQVAGFLSLPLARAPFDAAGGPAAAAPAGAGPVPDKASAADRLWTYRGRFGLLARGVGVVCLMLGLVLTFGLLSAGEMDQARWLVVIAAAASLCLLGAWLFVGGRRALIDADQQIVKVWRAWPLPPAIYELSTFYAVMLAPEGTADMDDEPPHLVGLIGPERLRLEVVRGLPRDEALPAATGLAAATRLPLIDEPPATCAAGGGLHATRGQK